MCVPLISNPFLLRLSNKSRPHSVIDAWSRRSGYDTEDRAEKILRRLVHNQQLTNNKFLLPDAITYTAVMKTYVNQPRGGEKALAILKEMTDQCMNGNCM